VFTAWENDDPQYGSRDQMASDLSEISAMSDILPITNAQQTFSEDAEAADSSLDEETQRQLQSLLEDLTLSLGNDRQSGLSQLAVLLSDVAQPAEPSHPGIHSNSLCCVALSNSCCSHSLLPYFPEQPRHISVS
jgi:hypothetical protein